MTTPVPAAALPGEWTFWADGATPPHAPLGPVTCTGFACSWELSNFGKGEAVVPIEDGGLARADLMRLYGWRLWASYAGQVVWAGLPTDLIDEGAATVALAFTELPGYLLRHQHATTNNYVQIEQTVIASRLAARLSNISVPIVTEPGRGVLRDRFYDYLEGGSRGELLVNLAEVIDGPEFRAEYREQAGRPQCRFRIAHPRVGGDSGLAVTVPGGAAGFSLSWSAERWRTRTFAIGELPDDAPSDAKAPVEVRDRPQAGYPRVDYVDDWPGVVIVQTLRDRADTNAANLASPLLTLDTSVPAHLPRLGTYGVGDDVAVTITDTLLPSGLHIPARLTAMSADASSGVVGWTVSNVVPPPKPREKLSDRLGYLDGMTGGMFRRNLTIPPGGTDPD